MPMQIQYQVIALILLIGLLVFGFLIPEQIRKRKKASEIASIVPGDRVVTQQGIRGTVQALEEGFFIIACEPDGARLQIAQWGIRNKE